MNKPVKTLPGAVDVLAKDPNCLAANVHRHVRFGEVLQPLAVEIHVELVGYPVKKTQVLVHFAAKFPEAPPDVHIHVRLGGDVNLARNGNPQGVARGIDVDLAEPVCNHVPERAECLVGIGLVELDKKVLHRSRGVSHVDLVRAELALAPLDILNVLGFLDEIFGRFHGFVVGNGIADARHFHEQLEPAEVEQVGLVEGDNLDIGITHIVQDSLLHGVVKAKTTWPTVQCHYERVCAFLDGVNKIPQSRFKREANEFWAIFHADLNCLAIRRVGQDDVKAEHVENTLKCHPRIPHIWERDDQKDSNSASCG